ncbi:MAG: nucleotide exchange factor GrpE [Oscillospiraceae bacterium]
MEVDKEKDTQEVQKNDLQEKKDDSIKEEAAVPQAPLKKEKKKKNEVCEKLAKEVESLEKDIAQLKDRQLRAAAEFDNYRKRTEREKLASAQFAVSGAVEKILPVLDTLRMAADAKSSDGEYKKGVIMTVDMFEKSLLSLGIEPIEALGKAFDPELHCAVGREPGGEAESGSVTREIQRGYKLGDRVVRHSMVFVAE